MDRNEGERLKADGRALLREHAWIGGWAVSDGEGRIEVDDPAEEAVLGTVPKLSRAQVDQAIDAASRAFPAWSRERPWKRAEVLHRWAMAVDARTDALAALLALENGKPFAEAKTEIAYANQFIRWFAGEAERLDGDVIPTPAGAPILTFKEAVGPVAAITPWNFPAAMVTRKLAPAFAAGCTVLLKPASATPFTSLALAELAAEAGLPDGVLSVVTGEQRVVGEALTGSPLVRKLTFTGSTPVGRLLAEQCAPTLKVLSMELGGAAPLVVFDDADLEVAVDQTIAGKFRNSGQTCVCPNRVYVQRGLFDAYVEALAAKVAQLKVGKAFEPEVKVGPLIDRKGVDKVADHVGQGQASGARLVTGGAPHALGPRFYTPTVLAGGEDELFRREETFGPLVPVFPFEDEAEAVRLANASEFGLASYLFTRDLDRALRVSRGIEAGIVGLNTGVISNAANPFGGVKQSGYGREGSKYGLEPYLVVKSVTIGGG